MSIYKTPFNKEFELKDRNTAQYQNNWEENGMTQETKHDAMGPLLKTALKSPQSQILRNFD